MACKQYEDRLSNLEDLLDGNLQGTARDELTRHLDECASCREEVEAARECSLLLREGLEPAPEPSGAFWYRVQAGIRTALSPGDFWTSLEWLARRLAWGAGLAVLVLGAFAAAEDYAKLREWARSSEIRELFPEPAQQPASNEEVLLTLAEGRQKR